jgi:hypothetical protein
MTEVERWNAAVDAKKAAKKLRLTGTPS